MRIARLAFIAASLLLCAQTARAEYVVLRSASASSSSAINWSATPTDSNSPAAQPNSPRAKSSTIEPEEVFHSTPRPALADISLPSFIQSAAQHHGVDADLIVSVITAESKFNPKAISRKNARGLMQLLPETATRLGRKKTFRPAGKYRSRARVICVSFSRVTTTISL